MQMLDLWMHCGSGVSFAKKISHSADVKTCEKPLIYIQAVRESQFVCMSAFTFTSE